MPPREMYPLAQMLLAAVVSLVFTLEVWRRLLARAD